MSRKIQRWITINGNHVPIYETTSIDSEEITYHQFEDEEDVKSIMGPSQDAWYDTFRPTEPTWEDGQFTSIGRYTRREYNKFNEQLRQGASISELSDYDQQMVKHLDAAISRFDLSTPIETYRQVRFGSLSDTILIDKDGNLLVDKDSIITDKGFMSTTINRSIAGHTITNGTNENTYIMSIQTPARKGIGALLGHASDRPYEKEFLFGRNTRYKIVGDPYKDAAGYWVVPVRVL